MKRSVTVNMTLDEKSFNTLWMKSIREKKHFDVMVSEILESYANRLSNKIKGGK